MIIAITEFKLPQVMSIEQAKSVFLNTAPNYKGMAGLIRKCYFLSEDGSKAGGVYLWNSRSDADRVYTDEWKTFVRGKYGCDPSLTFLDCPVVVDNILNEIISE